MILISGWRIISLCKILINFLIFVDNFLNGFELALLLFFPFRSISLNLSLTTLPCYGTDFKALAFKLIVLHQFISSTIIRISFIQDILTNFFKSFWNVKVKCEKLLYYLSVYLGVFVIHLLFRDEMKIVWQVLLIPNVILNFLQCYSFYWIRLEHQVNKIFYFERDIVWNEVSTLFDFIEKLRHLVIIKR